MCGGPAQEVDHIVPRSRFGKKRRAERDADSNLQAICTACHYRKHHGGKPLLTTQKKYRNPHSDRAGGPLWG